MNVPEYCTEEVRRQGHDILVADGIMRVGWMLDAWAYALRQVQLGHVLPVVDDVASLGSRVERFRNQQGIRECNVYVGNRACPPPQHLNRLLVELFESLREGKYKDNPLYEGSSLAFYKAFEEIHPFED